MRWAPLLLFSIGLSTFRCGDDGPRSGDPGLMADGGGVQEAGQVGDASESTSCEPAPSTETLSFAEISVGTSTTRVLEIRNPCREVWLVTDIRFEEGNSPVAVFTTSRGAPPFALAQDESASISVAIAPTEAGPIDDRLIISIQDGAVHRLFVHVMGIARR